MRHLASVGLCAITLGVTGFFGHGTIARADAGEAADVFAGFDLTAPGTGPFPSDIFTVPDASLETWTTLYRHDLAFAADSTIPKNPHLFAGQPTSPNSTVRAIARGAQEQIAVFFATFGGTIIHPAPAQFFEVPIAGSLPETLDFIR